VIVHHADGLHVGVYDGAADKFEAALLEIFAECVGFLRRGGYLLHGLPHVADWTAVDEAPNVFVERAECCLHV